jgi:hypothetical protein
MIPNGAASRLIRVRNGRSVARAHTRTGEAPPARPRTAHEGHRAGHEGTIAGHNNHNHATLTKHESGAKVLTAARLTGTP